MLDLHEMGGELCSLRRKEAEVLKKSDQKEEAAKIVANAESRWKTRLLTIFEYLASEIVNCPMWEVSLMCFVLVCLLQMVNGRNKTI